MAEYIDRGKLVEFLKQVRRDLPHDSKDFFTRDEMILNFQQFVESKSFVPSEDVEPVRRGHWICVGDIDEYIFECSECHEIYCLNDGTPKEQQYNYCPNCGAKMEEYKSDIT